MTVSLLATVVGFDRDRALYPIVLIVIASYYGLFAIMAGSMQALISSRRRRAEAPWRSVSLTVSSRSSPRAR